MRNSCAKKSPSIHSRSTGSISPEDPATCIYIHSRLRSQAGQRPSAGAAPEEASSLRSFQNRKSYENDKERPTPCPSLLLQCSSCAKPESSGPYESRMNQQPASPSENREDDARNDLTYGSYKGKIPGDHGTFR